MEYKLHVYSIWDPGKRVDDQGNPHQEDNMFPEHTKATEADRLFILCDGMGGHDAGEVASSIVCQTMSSSILSSAPEPEGPFTEEDLKKSISDAFDALDAHDDGTSEKKMGTTMTLLKLYNGGCYIAHMGDSRVYQIRPGKTAGDTKIIFRTEDHSLVNDLVKIGELTPEEARHSNRKNVITRAMQPNLERRPRADIYHTVDIAPGDYFYLCSDGMLENMEDHQLCYYFSNEAGDDTKKTESLLMATQENKDNHSAIIVHILEVYNPLPIPAPTPNPLVGEVNAARPQEATTPKSQRPSTAINKSQTAREKRSNMTLAIWTVVIVVVLAIIIWLFLSTRSTNKTKSTEPQQNVIEAPQSPKNNFNRERPTSSQESKTTATPKKDVKPSSSQESKPTAAPQKDANPSNSSQSSSSNETTPSSSALDVIRNNSMNKSTDTKQSVANDDQNVVSSDDQKVKDALNQVKTSDESKQ